MSTVSATRKVYFSGIKKYTFFERKVYLKFQANVNPKKTTVKTTENML